MEAIVTAITTTDQNIIKNSQKETLELMGGHSANICYTERDWEQIVKENMAKQKAE